MTWPALVLASLLGMHLATPPPARGAEGDTAATITESRNKIAEKKRDFDARVAAVDKEIAEAAVQKAINPSKQKFLSEMLGRFRTKADEMWPRFTNLYSPPKFEPSPEMEPLNVAWADLVQGVEG